MKQTLTRTQQRLLLAAEAALVLVILMLLGLIWLPTIIGASR